MSVRQRREPAIPKSLRWDRDEWAAIEKAAERSGVTVAVYQRRLILEPRGNPFAAERLRRIVAELDAALADPEARATRLASARIRAFELFSDLAKTS